MYKDIEKYGVIGDLHTVALVGVDGSIDFMSFPNFDSPTIFGALLDDEKGGSFQLSPLWEKANLKQMYLPDTNILFTRFLSSDGVAEISDYMPVIESGKPHTLIRRLKTVRGDIRYRVKCAPRFNYGRSTHQIKKCPEGILFISPDLTLLLRSDLPLEIKEDDAFLEFNLPVGKTVYFILERITENHIHPMPEDYAETTLHETVKFWRHWVNQSNYQGRWREMVNRSALTLKLLTSQAYGSMIASPTFGLPEVMGGARNWDYRYTWIRDTSFTLRVLIRLGYTSEARDFMGWFEARCNELKPDDSLQIMYRIDGSHELEEKSLDHWKGYKNSQPVRIGNNASHQTQLDIYGELMDAIYFYNQHGQAISYDLWKNLVRLNDSVCRNWRKVDKGIWEERGQEREFLYSKVMCWVALDRAIKLAMERSFPAPLETWFKTRDEIYQEIMSNYWDPKRGAFVQFKGATAVDAANLLMPIVGFISPTDPRWLSTLKAIEEELVDDSHVYRYRSELAAFDGLQGLEGTFCMCTFWYVECLSRAGQLNKARFIFEKMLGYSNHLGLFAEELGPSGEFLGNFPQAFTHLSLINAAFDLDKRLSSAGKD